ncbi:MAG TPA: hypothetical protein VHV57_08430 [Acidimicrobiales bacterium]|nr:hypothetical protein [Acidimicrobiales bacterium]
MDIVRNADGTLVVPVAPERHRASDETDETTGEDAVVAPVEASTRLLHPGEGGYDEALAEWDLQQNPDRGPAVSTPTGRQEAMALIHTVATSDDHAVAPAVEALDDPEASGEALRHVLVGGVHSVEDFASEIAEAEGGDVLTAHETTKIIGEVLTAID